MSGEKIPVLDHGYVRLIDHLGGDQSFVEAARMSTGKGFLGWDPRACDCCAGMEQMPRDAPCVTDALQHCTLCDGTGQLKGDAKLLEFLWKNKHVTPFEMGDIVIEVKAPIMVFREWHRSRTQSYNEMSGRYTVIPNEHYVPELDRFRQRAKNKQGSDGDLLPALAAQNFQDNIRHDQDALFDAYEQMLDEGLAPEVARINCPVSRYSVMRAKTNVRNWLWFLHLRMAPNAQLEIRRYAEAVASIVRQLFPRTWALFEEYTLYGLTLSRTEAALLRQFCRTHERAGLLSGLPSSLVKRLSQDERIGA